MSKLQEGSINWQVAIFMCYLGRFPVSLRVEVGCTLKKQYTPGRLLHDQMILRGSRGTHTPFV
jgi:hypothetical protein